MDIPRSQWSSAERLVEDDDGKLWRIVGFIDRPAVILDPIVVVDDSVRGFDGRHRHVEIMGSETSKRFHRLVRSDG